METRGDGASDTLEVRLKPLGEYRALLEEAGRFLLIEGEEITDGHDGLPVHLNATNLREKIPPKGGDSVRQVMANNIQAVRSQADRLGREMLVHLNHPNFGYAVTAEDLAAVTEERYFEVYNGHPAVHHRGDGDHPSVERLWDIANTLRLAKHDAPPLMGIAVDDAHNYHGKGGASPGRGWVRVRAHHLTPESIVGAMKRGDFYASSGVRLRSVEYDREERKLSIEIDPEEDATYTTRFVGTPSRWEDHSEPRTNEAGEPIRATRKYSDAIGTVFEEKKGTTPTYHLSGDELYVRAVVVSSEPPANPVYDDQRRKAWTQPVGWRR